jgi:nucleotide-binding universal stress UspA family protein
VTGIVVGVDGSGHSQRALEWAMTEAAERKVPLTVMTVHELVKGYYGGMVEYPSDRDLAEKTRQMVQAEVDQALAGIAGSRPESVTVRVASGSIVEELVSASKDADMLVVGSRGAGGFARLVMGSVSSLVTQHAACPVVIIPPEGRN